MTPPATQQRVQQAQQMCPRCGGRAVQQYNGVGRPPRFCGDRACYDTEYEKKRTRRKERARKRAEQDKKARKKAETEKMHNDMRARVLDISGILLVDGDPGRRGVVPRDGALVTVLDATERARLIGALIEVIKDMESALHALEGLGDSRLTERLNNDVEEIKHLARTYFPRFWAK